MPKRAPIEYKTQFGGGMFRDQEIVENERAALESETVAQEPVSKQPGQQTDAGHARNSGAVEETVERSNGRTVEQTNPGDPSPVRERNAATRILARARVRHSFDVGQDQLHALAEIQAHIFSETGKKPKLGDLVQEALDFYITRQEKRSNERTVERTNGRTNERSNGR